MGFDIVAWSESAAKNGLTALAAVADTRYQTSGDTHTLRGNLGAPWLVGMWGKSVTVAKLEGQELVGSKKIPDFGNISLDSHPSMQDIVQAVGLPALDVLTGYQDNGNTNEVSILNALIAYGDPNVFNLGPLPPILHAIRLDSTTDTGAAPGTWTDAAFTWSGLKRGANYAIAGILISGVDDIGFRIVPGEEPSVYKPGGPVGTLGYSGPLVKFAQPFPFPGSNPPSIEIISPAASAEHHATVFLI